jgi:hypothetical protein
MTPKEKLWNGFSAWLVWSLKGSALPPSAYIQNLASGSGLAEYRILHKNSTGNIYFGPYNGIFEPKTMPLGEEAHALVPTTARIWT